MKTDSRIDALNNLVKKLESDLRNVEYDRDWWRNQARVLADLAARKGPTEVTLASAPSDEFP